jgi:outer membrane receptor for monomeric catechols
LGAAFDKRLNTSSARITSTKAHNSRRHDAGAFFITHRVVHASNDPEALFANLTYKFTSRWALTVGGRYSRRQTDAEKYSADHRADPVTGVHKFL